MKVKNRAGQMVDKDAWKTTAKAPVYLERNLTVIEGERHARRPSSLAKKAGQRYPGPPLAADEYAGNRQQWEGTDTFPPEFAEEDVGWLAGPIDRPLPQFKGPTPGRRTPS